jgi:ABC-2 type transport system permease protein
VIPFAGSFLTLYTGLTLFLFAACGIGLLVSSLVGTMQQALLVSFMVAMPFTLLSGLFTSLSSMPDALQYFSSINPLRYMIEISRRVYLEGVGLDRLTFDLWPLAVTAIVSLSIGGWAFRHRLG